MAGHFSGTEQLMTRETKIGLLVGMGVIIVIGILISDHLSEAQHQSPAELAGDVPEISRDMIPPPVFSTRQDQSASAQNDGGRLPMPRELSGQSSPQRSQPAQRQQRPDIIRQDLDRELYATMKTHEEQPPQVTPPQPKKPVDRNDLAERAAASRAERQLREQFIEVDQRQAPVAVESGRARSESEPIVHYIQEDETLAAIARKYYGDPNAYTRIVEANKKALPNPNVIRPGVRIVIPETSADSSTSSQQRPATRPSQQIKQYDSYTIGEGDTLSSIAKRFFGSAKQWQKVYELNKDVIDNPDRVAAGTTIRVPSR